MNYLLHWVIGKFFQKICNRYYRIITVHIIDLIFGETGESAQYWNSTANPNVEDCKKIRRNEAEKAAAVMGATIEFMDYDDYPLIITRGRIKELSFKIQKLRSEIILTHWDKDSFNVDHTMPPLPAL